MVAFLAGCAGEGVPADATVLAVGDSILAWNREEGASIPEVAGRELDRVVHNVAVSGSWITGDEDDAIPAQYVEGSWDWVIADGGANDLNGECECGDCDAVMDTIIAEDARAGEYPVLADRVRAGGARLLVMSYPRLPPGARFGFDRCEAELETLSARQAALAAARDDVFFVDVRPIVDGTDLALFVADQVHPSIAGGEVMGKAVADAISAAQ